MALLVRNLDTVVFKSENRIKEDLGVTDVEVINMWSTVYNLSLIANSGTDVGLFGTFFPILAFPKHKKVWFKRITNSIDNDKFR